MLGIGVCGGHVCVLCVCVCMNVCLWCRWVCWSKDGAAQLGVQYGMQMVELHGHTLYTTYTHVLLNIKHIFKPRT